jgi:Protein of unknown function (DUF2380)
MGIGRSLTRREALPALALLPALARAQQTAALPLRSVYVLDFEVMEDHPLPDRAAAQAERARQASVQLRTALTESGLYRVLDAAPAAPLVQSLRERHTWLHQCTECAQSIGRAASAELVLLPWAQVVSQLIINLNVELREVASDRVLLNKSVDLRSNNDESWQRGVRFMVRDWTEKRAANAAYGR